MAAAPPSSSPSLFSSPPPRADMTASLADNQGSLVLASENLSRDSPSSSAHTRLSTTASLLSTLSLKMGLGPLHHSSRMYASGTAVLQSHTYNPDDPSAPLADDASIASGAPMMEASVSSAQHSVSEVSAGVGVQGAGAPVLVSTVVARGESIAEARAQLKQSEAIAERLVGRATAAAAGPAVGEVTAGGANGA